MNVKRGMVFTHWSMLDPDWQPGPGQSHRDAPKATMRVTRVTTYAVYYGYATGGGGFVADRDIFLERLEQSSRS